MQEMFLQAETLIKRAHKILCISHKKPDGDTIGSTIALSNVLRSMEKEVVIACIDDIPEKFSFLDGVQRFVKEFDFREFDLIIVSDAGASYMTRYHEIYPDIFKGEIPVINIDHHASNDDFGTLNIVDINSASTTLVLYKMFVFLNINITPEMAMALLCGIYNDTGGLMHSNTTLEVFEITGKLVELGGRTNIIAKNLFRNTSISSLKVWGRALERTTVNDQGVVVTVLTNSDLDELDAKIDDISGLVDFLNAVPGSKFTVLLNEDAKGNVKGSFRTRRDDVDLAELAGKFGGGGHKKASGFTMPGRIHQEVRWKVLPVGEVDLDEPASGLSEQNKQPQDLLSNILQIPEV
jgi:bifunctional oligoribonuclease and PAP phosphatase NrnA